MLRIRLHTLYVSVPSISLVAKPLRLMCRFSMLLSYTGWLLYHLPTRQFLPPANEVWGKVIFLHQFVILFTGGACVVAWGACVVAPGGCGFIWGCAWFYLGGHAWFYWGACVVLFGGHAWFYLGGHVWFYSGGGMCGFFSLSGYNEIRSMSGRYASYWNAFLFEELNSVALFYLNYSQKVTFVTVYENIDQKIVVVQQRSPLVKVCRIWMNWSFWDASLELKMMCPIISGQKEAVYWQTNKLDRWKQIQSNYNTHWVICTWKKRFTAYWVSSYHSNNFRYIPLLKMFNIHAEIKKGTIC